MLKDKELFKQLMNSIQRQLRLLGKDNCEHIIWMAKILKVAMSDAKRNKPDKIKKMINRFKKKEVHYFSPTELIRLDDDFIKKICAEQRIG